MDKVQSVIYKALGYEPWASQLEFHESTARYKFLGAGSRYGKSFSGAMDVLPDILKPDTRGWIVGPCVDASTEILTTRGWLRYNDLMVGDIVLTLNSSGYAEWQQCQKVHSFLADGDAIEIKQRGHDSLSTINHNWIVGNHSKGKVLGFRKVTIDCVNKNDFVLAAAPVINLPTIEKYRDSFVELIAWYWTEGNYSQTSQGCRISQNKGAEADRINKAAWDFLGAPQENLYYEHDRPQWVDWKTKTNKFPEQGHFSFNVATAKMFRAVAPLGVLSASFIVSLTREQLELLLEVSILADGSERSRVKKSGKVCRDRVIIQKDKKRIDQIQIVTQLLGLQTVLRFNKTRDDYTLQIFERNRVWIGQSKKATKHYSGVMWCPQTANGTWFARRNGTVYSTGNSYEQPSKEFRYIYDALCNKLGYKPKNKVNVDFTNPGPQSLLFPWGSEVTTKSEQNQDSLLGEEVDWMILSEGSRLKEQTYDNYLRARLGSRHGRVIVPTTPHGFNWLYKRFYVPSIEGDPEYWGKVGIKVTENPKFAQEEYDKAKKELPEDVFAEQYDGEFVAWSGLIFKKFTRSKHIIAPFPIPVSWPVYCAIDPHPSTPVAILWLTVDTYGTWYICHEMFKPDLTIPEIARKLKAMEKKCPVSRYLVDPNAKYIDKLRGQTASVQMQFRRAGIPVVEASNKFEGAWYKISEYLRPQPVYGDQNILRPKLLVFKDCPLTIEQFETYTWEGEKSNTQKFHMMDCLKYIVNDTPGRPLTQEEEEEIRRHEEALLNSRNKETGY